MSDKQDRDGVSRALRPQQQLPRAMPLESDPKHETITIPTVVTHEPETLRPSRVRVTVTEETTPARTVTLNVRKYVPAGGPSAIVANALSEPAKPLSSAAARAQGLLFLCRACGQEATLGREWVALVDWSGPVRCPACNGEMSKTEWPIAGLT